MKNDIIEKLKEYNLKGRGGGSFETWKKWELVKNNPYKEKYIICNAAEGELEVLKDGFILENYPEEIIKGINIAIETIKAKKAYLYLRSDYYSKYKDKLIKVIGDNPITIFKKPEVGYIGGEETTICEIIEGKAAIPRQKPPYLSEKGLFGCPTLINNTETFYCVSKISQGTYLKERFYTLSGDISNKGIFSLPEDISIEEILKKTGNYPKEEFFVQAGGGSSGEIFLKKELLIPVPGTGSIVVFNKKTDIYSLIEKWTKFFHEGNCDKCAPCREGIFLICEMAKNKKINFEKFEEIILSLENSSFCALGKNAAIPLKSILKIINEKHKA